MNEPFDQQVTKIAKDMEGLPPDLVNSRLETLAAENPALHEALTDHLNAVTVRVSDEQGTSAPTHSEQVAIQPTTSMTGMRLGSCVLDRLIAEGGMGAVYEGRQDPLGRKVAIKLMKSGLISLEARQRFSYEARLLGNLAHPGIAQVFESGVCEVGAGGVAIPYIVMELVPEARTLSAFVRDEHLSVREICELYLVVCDAVNYAHQHGIIHRDLKPANILVDKDGRPRVIDFGVAHVDDEFLTRSFETDANSIVGTLPYMSPEQVGEGESVDVRSDQYTLGVILFELLCGHRPYEFDGRSLPQAIEIIKGVAPKRPSSFQPDLANDLETIVLKTLRKERQERYPAVDDLADDIRNYLAGRPVQARPTSMAYQVRLFARRNKTLVMLSTAFIVFLIGATIFSVIQARDATAAAEEAKDQKDSALRLLAETRSFSEWLIIDLLNEVAMLPGSTPLTEKLARKVAGHLDSIAADATIDPEVQRSISLAYMEIGGVLGSPSRPNLGRREEALKYLEKAESGFLARWQEDATPRRTLDLCVVQSVLADVRILFGQNEEAKVLYENGLKRLESMKTEGDLLQKRNSLLASYRRDYGLFLSNQGQAKEGIEFIHQAIELRQEILASEEHTATDRRKYLGDISTLSQIYSLNGLATKAESTLRPMVQGVRDRAKDGMLEAEDCATIVFQLADSLSVQKGKEKEALDLFMEVLDIREDLSKRDTDNISRLASLATILERCATLVLFVEKDNKKSLGLIERTVTAARQILQIAPNSTHHKERLRIALGRLASTLNFMGQVEKAHAASEESFGLAKDLFEKSPKSPDAIRGLGEAWTMRGHIWVNKSTAESTSDEMMHNYESAAKSYIEGRELYQSLVGSPNEPYWVKAALKTQAVFLEAAQTAVLKLKELIGK